MLGFACGAISTGTIGGALATGFIALGMLLFLAFLFRDLGLSEGSSRSPRPTGGSPRTGQPPPTAPSPPTPPRPSTPPERHGDEPRTGARMRASVRRPERVRGQRRRLH